MQPPSTTPPPRSDGGAGLAVPAQQARRDQTFGLTELQDALVLGALRRVRARMEARGNAPAVRGIDEALPEVAQGLATLLRFMTRGVDIDTEAGGLDEGRKGGSR